jgi:N-acetylmuramoyl-L-alanine amidase
MASVVIDPGHGGVGRAGGASGAGVVGARGTLEKHVTLAVARTAAHRLRALGHRAALTRDDDRLVTLAARAHAAAGADAFVSLHFDGDVDPRRQGTAIFVHDRATAASERLADALDRRLTRVTGFGGASIARAPLAVLGALVGCQAACHAELAFLTDPAEERRLAEPHYLARLGNAIGDAIAEAIESATDAQSVRATSGIDVEVWWEVPLVPQVTGMSCWAAAAAMLIGWRDSVHVDPEEVARACGRWAEYRDGLEVSDVRGFAAAWHLIAERPAAIDARQLHRLLTAHGPLWIGEASPGLHVVVVTGMVGDGTDRGTRLRVLDPWPIGRGERYSIPVAELARTHRALAGLTEGEALVLHTGGRRAR